MPHAFYIGFRIALHIISWANAIASALQLYQDRQNHEMFVWPHWIRVFRLCAFIGSITSVVLSVDFYGADGIYSATTRDVLFTFWFRPAIVALSLDLSRELAMASSFIPINQRKWQSVMYYAVCGHLFVDSAMQLLSVTTKHRVISILAHGVGAWTGVFLLALIVGVYMTMKHHHRPMREASVSSQDDWQKMLRYWRRNAAAALLSMMIVLVIVASPAAARRGELQTNVVHIKNFDEVPDIFAIVIPIGILSIYTVIIWRSYVCQAAHSKRSSTSNASADMQLARLTPASPSIEMVDVDIDAFSSKSVAHEMRSTSV